MCGVEARGNGEEKGCKAYLQDRSEQHIRSVTEITWENFIQLVSRGEPIIVMDALVRAVREDAAQHKESH